MKITCLSDLHGHYPTLKGGGLLLLAGDYTASDKISEWGQFFLWLKKQPYRKKIFTAGNHDNFMLDGWTRNQKEANDLEEVREWLEREDAEFERDDFEYLCDSGTEFEGLKIWGSPWTKTFKGMNPRCKAFTMDTEDELADKWKLIPNDIDILITHSPPFSILDETIQGVQVGSTSLLTEHINRLKPKLWVWGHIHEAYGQTGPYRWNNIKYVNASHVNERYQPVNAPVTITL